MKTNPLEHSFITNPTKSIVQKRQQENIKLPISGSEAELQTTYKKASLQNEEIKGEQFHEKIQTNEAILILKENNKNIITTARRANHNISSYNYKELLKSSSDLYKYIENYSKIYTLTNQKLIDNKAYWIDQGEIGFLNENEIKQGIKLGTTNIQQCVALMIKGYDKDKKELAALAHIDRFTTEKSIKEVFNGFEEKSSIILYGGRDQGPLKTVSDNNIKTVINIIKELEIPKEKCQFYTGEKCNSENIVFNPKSNLKQGHYPSKNLKRSLISTYERKELYHKFGKEIGKSDISEKTDRSIDLQVADLNKKVDTKDLKTLYTIYEKDYSKTLDNFLGCLNSNESWSMKEAYISIQPLVKKMHKILTKNNVSIDKNNIYNTKLLNDEKFRNSIYPTNLNKLIAKHKYHAKDDLKEINEKIHNNLTPTENTQLSDIRKELKFNKFEIDRFNDDQKKQFNEIKKKIENNYKDLSETEREKIETSIFGAPIKELKNLRATCSSLNLSLNIKI